MFLFTLLGQKIWQNFPSIIIIWCWFSQTFLSSSHFRTVFGETKFWQTFLRNLNATILQKSSQVRLYFKLNANINSSKISQCFTILKQDYIECKALVSNYREFFLLGGRKCREMWGNVFPLFVLNFGLLWFAGAFDFRKYWEMLGNIGLLFVLNFGLLWFAGDFRKYREMWGNIHLFQIISEIA